MVITTASKLMQANDAIEHLEKHLEELEDKHEILANMFKVYRDRYHELQVDHEVLESQYNELKDKLEHPWWKFW